MKTPSESLHMAPGCFCRCPVGVAVAVGVGSGGGSVTPALPGRQTASAQMWTQTLQSRLC